MLTFALMHFLWTWDAMCAFFNSIRYVTLHEMDNFLVHLNIPVSGPERFCGLNYLSRPMKTFANQHARVMI